MGPTGCPETSVFNKPTLRYNPEDGNIKAVFLSVRAKRKEVMFILLIYVIITIRNIEFWITSLLLRAKTEIREKQST
jgi:hypothetical protein